jgi:hypothetical protein
MGFTDGADERDHPCRLAAYGLGGFDVLIDGTPVPTWISRRGETILKLLLIRGGDAVHREELMSSLWPEAPYAQARNHARRGHRHHRSGYTEAAMSEFRRAVALYAGDCSQTTAPAIGRTRPDDVCGGATSRSSTNSASAHSSRATCVVASSGANGCSKRNRGTSRRTGG